jgi:hypothetical protein
MLILIAIVPRKFLQRLPHVLRIHKQMSNTNLTPNITQKLTGLIREIYVIYGQFAKELLMLDLPVGQKLGWKQDNLTRRTYTLRRGEQAVAQLNYTGAFNNEALVRPTAESDWLLKFDRKGMFSPTVTSKTTDATIPGTEPMTLDWVGKGEVRLENGRAFRWQPLNAWHTEWGFLDENGRTVIECKQNHWFTGGSILIHDNDLKSGELTLLATLGWYKSINYTYEMTAVFVILLAVIIAI